MSRNVAVAIVGSGKTTRNNVESLIADFKDAVDSLSFIIPTTDVSDGMVWAKQYAEAHDMSVIEDESVYSAIDELKLLTDKTVDLKFFLLWDDDDPTCQNAVAFAQEHGIPVFDLTDGLLRVPIDEVKVDARPESTMPASETDVSPEPEAAPEQTFVPPPRDSIFEAEQEPILPWDFDDESESAQLIYEGIQEAGRVLARAFVDEMLNLLKNKRDDEDEAE